MTNTEIITDFTTKIANYTLQYPDIHPKQNYVSILIVRELLSAARFTTDGTEANSAILNIQGTDVTVGKLFGRKQVASDRRMAKALQRSVLESKMKTIDEKWKGCSMGVTDMCQKCPECILFGSAASDEGISITSRVLYDEAYTIRSLGIVVEEVFQNAPGDNYAKTPTSGIREPDFFKEGTLFPCVVTLRDVTAEEVLFFLNVTDRNSRYGATGTRFGKTKNHILGIFCSHREGPSSLEISREIALKMTREDDMDLNAVMNRDTLDCGGVCNDAVILYENLAEKHRIMYDKIDSAQVSAVLHAMQDDAVIQEILEKQVDNIQNSTFLTVKKNS